MLITVDASGIIPARDYAVTFAVIRPGRTDWQRYLADARAPNAGEANGNLESKLLRCWRREQEQQLST